MNKTRYKVIFNRTLHRLVVVSELAKSEGKAKEVAGGAGLPLWEKVVAIRPLAFSLLMALGFVSFSSPSLAEALIIQADKSAPKNTQPIVLQTANGLPQVNIQTPNDKGLSHNKYTQFSVAEKGAILNNSRTNVQTQQAGWVQGNPYLARGEAKVILNEVTSNNPSVLKGYVEVAGKKAEVIIANPSGIRCEGCGVINSDRTTLTTGKPQIRNGNLESFVVEKGKVTVSGKGLDNSRVDYTEILAREAAVNAGVWSKKETNVITGKNTVKRSDSSKSLQIIHTKQPLAGEAQPQYALDVSELGGMYSGKIQLIGTEQGVGVRNAGHIGASAETLQIDSQGRIINTGTLNAQKVVQLAGSKGIENRGKIENHQGNIQLTSQADIQQDGSVVARAGNLYKQAGSRITQKGETLAKGNVTYQAPNVIASTSSRIAAGVAVKDTAQGEVRTLEKVSAQGKTIAVKATEKATLQGKNVASGKVQVNASEANLDNSHTSSHSIHIQAHQGKIQADNTVLVAEKTIVLRTPTQLQTQNSDLKAEKISTEQRSLNSQNATWVQTGRESLQLNVVDKFQNQGGTIKTQGDLVVNAKGVDNQQGRLLAGANLLLESDRAKVNSSGGILSAQGNLTLNSGELINDRGLIQAQHIGVNTHRQRLSNQQTKGGEQGIIAQKTLRIESADLENQQGMISSEQQQRLNVATLNNTQGLIQSYQNLFLQGNHLNNNDGKIIAVEGGNISLSGRLNQQSGQIGAKNLQLRADEIVSREKSVITAESATLQVAGQLDNQRSLLHTTQALHITSEGINNTQGTISGTDVVLNVAGAISQVAGKIGAEKLLLNAGSLYSTAKSVISAKIADLSLQGELSNQASEIFGNQSLTIKTKGKLNNQQGLIFSEGNLSVNTEKAWLENQGGKIIAGQEANLSTGEVFNQQGRIQAKGDLWLNTATQALHNQQGNLSSQANLALKVGRLANEQGEIQGQHLQIHTANQPLDNRNGVIQAQQNLTVQSSQLINHNGTLNASVINATLDQLEQKTGRIQGAELVNLTVAKAIRSTDQSQMLGGTLAISSQGQLINRDSQIVALGGNATLNTKGIENQNGTIASEQAQLHLISPSQWIDNQGGKLSAKGDLVLTSNELNNQQGLVQSGANLSLTTGVLRNNQTQAQHKGIFALGEMNINATTLHNQQGQVVSLQNQRLQAKTLRNEAGIISSLAHQVLNISQTINNDNGRISGASSKIFADQITNQQGRIQGNSHLTVTTRQLSNLQGHIQSEGNLVINATTNLDNQQGNISSEAGSITLATNSSFNNQQGKVIAKDHLNLTAYGVNNQGGGLYAEQGELSILAAQHPINNEAGKLISQNRLTLSAGELINRNGVIFAKNQGNLTASQQIINTQGGEIASLGDLNLRSSYLDNQGGQLRSQGDLRLNVSERIDNQAVGKVGSMIDSNGELTLTTQTLNNNGTAGTLIPLNPTQGIIATVVNATASTVANVNGTIYQREQGEWRISQRLDNQQGRLVSNGNLNVAGQGLTVSNQKGKLQANQRLSIEAQSISNEGDFEADDLRLTTTQADFHPTGNLNASSHLSIETTGNLTNALPLYANQSLKLTARNITNSISGKISSAETTLMAQQDIQNKGLINSVNDSDTAQTLLKAGGTLRNQNGGRIYGDKMALQADRLINQDGENKTPIIAARQDLAIGAREIDNQSLMYRGDKQSGSTLLSLGTISFGRYLNAQRQTEGQAEVLRNQSSLIEAKGDLKLNVAHIQNENIHFNVTQVKTGEEADEITKIAETKISETYIIPEGKPVDDFVDNRGGEKGKIAEGADPRISTKLLRWGWWSKAGQWEQIADDKSPTVLKAGDVITADMVLATRNEQQCDEQGNHCQATEAGRYGLDSPIWAYANTSAPKSEAPPYYFDELEKDPETYKEWYQETNELDENGNKIEEFLTPEEPRMPSKPTQAIDESEEDYQARMAQYRLAMQHYEKQKAKWDFYVTKLKPYIDWTTENEKALDAVDKKIEEHNENRTNNLRLPSYREYWEITLTKRQAHESKVTQTVPAQILVGGNIDFESNRFNNNQSTVIAGGQIGLQNQILNQEIEGLHRLTESGSKFYSYGKKRHKPRKSYKRKRVSHGVYQRIIETPFNLPVYDVRSGVNESNAIAPEKVQHRIEREAVENVAMANIRGATSQESRSLMNLSQANWTNISVSPQNIALSPNWKGKGQAIGGSEQGQSARHLAQISLNEKQEVRSITPNLELSRSSLFRVNASPQSRVLVETDPDFTQQKRWLSSDYMFNALRVEPNQAQKRLGDGYYEQRLVREQINRLTGRQFVGNYTDFDSQYRGLMDAGVTFAQKFNLRPGIALSASQVAQLTTDIVWLENEQIRLPNGKVETVLVPKVYALAKKGDITGNGTLLSAHKITHQRGEFINRGIVAGRELVQFDSQSLRNMGKITGGAIISKVSGDTDNLGGIIEADRTILLKVAGNFNHSSTTQSTQVNEKGYQRSDITIARKGLLHIKGENGTLQIQAGNLTILGADIVNDGQGQTYLFAKNNLNLTALQTGFTEKMGGGKHYRNESAQTVEISRVKGKGDVVLSAKNLMSEGAAFESKQKLALLAENDLVLNSATQSSDYAEYHKTKSRNLLGSSSKATFNSQQVTAEKGSALLANQILLQAGNDVTLVGTQAAAKENIQVVAGNNLLLDVARTSVRSEDWSEKKKSGLLIEKSAGSARVGVGMDRARGENTQKINQVQGVDLFSGGNLTLVAGGDLTANAALLASGKDMLLQGKNVALNAVEETNVSQSLQSQKSSGFGVGVTYNPVAAFKQAYREQAGQGSAGSVVGKIITGSEALDKTAQKTAQPFSPYMSSKRSQSNQSGSQINAVVSELNSGGNLSVIATDGNITAEGALLSAKGDGLLWASQDMTLGTASDYQSQSATSKQKGLDIDSSRRPTEMVGAYRGKEKGKGESEVQQASQLSFGGKTNLTAEKGNLTLVGTQLVSEGNIALTAGKDIRFATAVERTSQTEQKQSYGIGEAVVSETERFSGLNRKLENQSNSQERHKGALVASLKGDVTINAGGNYHQTSGQLLAKNRLDISAEQVTFDTAINRQTAQQKQSDLKLGQFSRVVSPLIDLVQSVESALTDKEASDRIKTAQMLGAVAKGYTAYTDAAAGGAIIRAESGVGFSHSRNQSESQVRESQGNHLNAQQINITARGGDLTAIQTAFTSKDSQGNRLANSQVNLNAAKDILLMAGESQTETKGKQQSVGSEVGMGVSVGAQTGVYVYAQEGFSKGKQSQKETTYQNSRIETETINLTSGGNTTLKGARAQAKTINADIKGDLNIISLQDEGQSRSQSIGAGGRVQGSFGTAWGASGYGSGSSGKGTYKQVQEQSGLFAEEGGYHINANNVHLKGGAIASTNPANSELATNKLTFEDIQNRSQSQAISGGISGSANLTNAAGNESQSHKEGGENQAKERTNATQSNGISPSLPMVSRESDSSMTKATLTEGKITLNKDSNPMQTTAKALGINTELSQANQQIQQPKDINKMLKEQQTFAQSAGNVAGAVNAYANQKAEEARAKAEEAKISGNLTAYTQAKAEQESWEQGGSTRRNAQTVANVINVALAGGNAGAVGVAAVSPYLNEKIKEATTNENGEVNKPANLLGHAILGAIEAKATGNNALAGAVAGATGEATAMLLTQGKSPKDLTESEKQNVVALSQLASGIAGGIVGDSTSNAVAGAEIGKTAVENNFLSQAEYAELDYLMKKKILTQEDAIRVQYLLEKDKVSNKLLHTWQTQPEKLDKKDKNTLFKWVDEYGNIPQQIQLLNTPTNSSQIKPDYSDLKFRAQKVYNYSGSFEGKSSESLSNGLLLLNSGGVARTTASVITKLEKASVNINSKVQPILNNAKNLVEKYPNAIGAIADGGVALGTHVGYKVSTGQDVNPYEAIGAFSGGVLTRNQSLGNQIRINVGVATVTSLSKEPSGKDLGNAYFGAITSPIVNVPFTKFGSAGNALGGYASEYIGDLENRNKEIKNILDKINSFQGENNEK